MKYKTFQIFWHDRKPIFAADFLENEILATGGADNTIRTWKVRQSALGDVIVALESELTGMSGSINCIRVSPKGELSVYAEVGGWGVLGGMFAVGGDKGEVVIWKRNVEYCEEDEFSKPWRQSSFLRGHVDDVFDLSWSSDGTCLATASLEGVTIVWDIGREKAKARLCEHHHYVQGVAWDPFNQFIVSQGGDRRCKVYTLPSTEHQTVAASKLAASWKVSRTLFRMKHSCSHGDNGSKNFLFYDETLPSFFRRLDWSPDGSFLVIPAGLWHQQENQTPLNVAFVYSRNNWSKPVACLPAPGEPYTIIRCCPVLFLRTDAHTNSDVVDLPYEVVFACATLHSLAIYKSGDLEPLLMITGLHYAEITDMAWSPDARFLTVSSKDGYCSIVHFEDGDLGTRINNPMFSLDSCTSEWFKALEAIKAATDPVMSRKQSLSQKLSKTDEPQKSTDQEKTRSKRRIAPIAITKEEVNKPASDKEISIAVEKRFEAEVVELFSTKPSKEHCADLLKFVEETEPSSPATSAKDRSFSQFLSMTQNYAKSRFA